MLLFIEKQVRRLFDWFEGLKGVGVVVKLHSEFHPGDSFQVSTTAGFGFQIYCKELQYRNTYTNPLAPSKIARVYRVSCVCDDKMPEELRDCLSKEHYLPETVSSLTTKNFRKKAAVNAFLAILIAEISASKKRQQV